MVGIVIVSHSAKLAEGVLELARQMGGEDVALAATGGIDDPDDPIGTDAFAIKEAIEAVWSDDGVLVLMDLGSAVMNAETALDFLEPPADASAVLLCEAALVEGAVAAVASARIGASLSEVADEARSGLHPKVEHLRPGAGDDRRPDAGLAEGAPSVRLTIPNRLGLHLRPAGRLVELVARFDAEVELTNVTTGSGPVSARSLSRVSGLGVRQGHVVEVRAEGDAAAEVLAAVEQLAGDHFGDRDLPEPVTLPPSSPVTTLEGVIGGVGAAPGVAVGPARRLVRAPLTLPERTPDDPEVELGRLREAALEARRDVEHQRTAAAGRAGDAEATIFDAHLLILDDEALWEMAVEATEKGGTAETAWGEAVEKVAETFRGLDDAYQAERVADVEAVGRQVLGHLLGVDTAARMEEPGVLIADDLTPGETATLDPEKVQAIVTSAGGATSHSAIIARALGVPAVVAVGPLAVAEGTILLVDGTAGTVTVDPDEGEIAVAADRIRVEAERAAMARQQAAAPAVTVSGSRVEVAANVGSVADTLQAVEEGADGVGLLRTEFLYLDRRNAPPEDHQEATYRQIAEALDGRPLVLRTLDVGGDKPLPFLPRPREENPFLGVRGVRLGLAEPDLLLTQIRAALRVAADHPLRIMFPMVATLGDWEAARSLVARAAEDVGGMPAGLELGIMVEVPSVPLVAESFAPVVDFFSVGTNDLTQYTLAAERGNPDLAGLTDALHPSVLGLVERTCLAAAGHGRWVGVCGELAADPVAIPILLGLGVTELSMSPIAIPRAKQIVRKVEDSAARTLAAEVLAMGTAEDVRQAARRFLASID